MSFREYQEKRPKAEWVSLTDAQLNLLNSAYVTSRGSEEINEVYIAVEAAGNREKEPALVLLASKDRDLIDLMSSISNKLNALQPSEELTPELLKSLFPEREVTGLMRFGIDEGSKMRDKLAELDLALAEGFIIINDGDKPNLPRDCTILAVGLLAAFSLLWRHLKTVPPAPVPPSLPPIP